MFSMARIAVITPTVNTAHLERCIQSVKKQTVRTEHYVINDGKPDFSCGAEHIINLPENTGRAAGKIWNGQRIYAGLPFLINADFILFLDEDNWFEPDHVESMVDHIMENKLDWCYSLRNIMTKEGGFVCKDDCESLGKWSTFYDKNLRFVDTSCYCIRGDIAPKVSPFFYTGGWGEDRIFYKQLSQKYTHFDCTGKYSVNYRARPDLINMFVQGNELMKQHQPNQPWRKQ